MKLIETIKDYGAMIKFAHTIFALPFAGLSFILAIENSELNSTNLKEILIYVILCMVSARSAAMGFNRYADREIDKLNPRTSNREIPSGKISEASVLFFISLSSIIFIVSSFMINLTCFYLSIPALFIILFYSYSKRFTYLCHYILGIGIGIAPVGAWVAVRNEISLLSFIWFLGLTFYISGFDILYSSQDIEFDKNNQLHSIPSRFGIPIAFTIAKLSHLFSFSLFVYAGYLGSLSIYYYIFVILTGILFIIEHSLVSPKDLTKVPIAFFHINAVISLILFIGVIIDKWKVLGKLI